MTNVEPVSKARPKPLSISLPANGDSIAETTSALVKAAVSSVLLQPRSLSQYGSKAGNKYRLAAQMSVSPIARHQMRGSLPGAAGLAKRAGGLQRHHLVGAQAEFVENVCSMLAQFRGTNHRLFDRAFKPQRGVHDMRCIDTFGRAQRSVGV